MSEHLLDADTIREHRALLDGDLPHRCNVETNANAGTDRAPSWMPAAKRVRCKVSPFGDGQDAVRGEQNQSIGNWRVRFKAGEVVDETNRLIVESEDGTGSQLQTLVVMSVRRSAMSCVAACRDATAAER